MMYAPAFYAPTTWTRQAIVDPDRKILEFPKSVTFCEVINDPDSDIQIIKKNRFREFRGRSLSNFLSE